MLSSLTTGHRPLITLPTCALWLSLLFTSTVLAGPAEGLLKLVPADAGATLVVEDLRGHVREVFGSPLAEGFRRLPPVREWLASERFRGLEQARRQIEQVLGTPITTVRDDLFGDAVVLTIHLPAGGRPDEARGLLMTRVRNRSLLERVVTEVNSAQTRKGEIARVVDRSWQRSPYAMREYRDGMKPAEFYVTLDDGTFAWSNSEALIQGVIDRRAGVRGASGLGDEPKYQRVRRKLPDRALAAVFLDPRFLERILASAPRTGKPGEDPIPAMAGRHLGAVEFAGAALEWRNGVILHTEETLHPAKLDPWIKTWAAHSSKVGPTFRRVPASALALATTSFDFGVIVDALSALVPASGQAKLANGLEVLRGVLLGRDLKSAILPYLGPGALLYADAPAEGDSKPGLAPVLAIELGGDSTVSAAVDNALRTLLALYALDDKHGQGQLRVSSRAQGAAKVTALEPESPFAYALDRDRLVIGSTPDAVARALSPASDSRLERFWKAHVSSSASFACVDLIGLRSFAAAQRSRLIKKYAAEHHRPEAAEAHDFDQVLALMDLFAGAYFTSALAPDATSAHRSLGVVAKP